ncbi:Hypothetical protein D9617_2g059200 [Elsinoe fawcettii]|nr:Hypothetical protein D9617_2g059200 [Elsinoe fawcettii]
MAGSSEEKSGPALGESNYTIKSENWMKRSGYDLLTSARFADCQIKVTSRTIQVHRIILTSACPYFDTVFGGSFKEAGDQTLDWKDEEEILVDAVLRFIYGCSYNHVLPLLSKVPLHVRLYAFADRINHQPLKNAAAAYLMTQAETKNFTSAEVQTILNTIDEYLPSSDTVMHVMATKCVKKNLKVLKDMLKDTKDTFGRNVPMIGGLLLAMSDLVEQKPSKLRYYRCAGCTFRYALMAVDFICLAKPKACPKCASSYEQNTFEPENTS